MNGVVDIPFLARVVGFEPTSKVLETRMLPLHHTHVLGKGRMVRWTIPFIIGFTSGSSNSDDINFPPLPGISCQHSPINLYFLY